VCVSVGGILQNAPEKYVFKVMWRLNILGISDNISETVQDRDTVEAEY